MIRHLPIKWQARFWAWWALRRYGKTSHFRIEAIRMLRRTSGLTLKETAVLINDQLERMK